MLGANFVKADLITQGHFDDFADRCRIESVLSHHHRAISAALARCCTRPPCQLAMHR